MREQQRRDYLAAMGIPVWVPRRELPFAAPSRLLPAEEAACAAREADDGLALASRLQGQASAMAALETATQVKAHAPPATPAMSGAAEATAKPVATVDATPAPALVPPPPVPVSDQPLPVVDLSPPRFELHFVVTGAVVWVTDDLSALNLLSRFADRVAMSMGYPRATLRPVTFRWPFIDNPREDQSASVARQALSAQWSFFEHHGGQVLVGFGTHSQRWLTPLTEQNQTFAEPLERVLSTAELKKQLWLSLRRWIPTSAGE